MDIPMETPFPDISKELVSRLNELYPEKCASPDDSYQKVWFKSGQRNVVNFLIEQHKRQTETIR